MASQELFQRRCSVTVDTLELPGFDVSFEVVKTLKPQPNTCELSVYNLSDSHRAQLQELSEAKGKPTQGVPCRIEAGYASGTSLIWLGDLRTVETTYESPDWVTRVSSGDGEKGWKNARDHVSFGPRTPLATSLRAMARALGVNEGNLSKVVSKLRQAGVANYPHGTVLSGATSREIRDFARSAGLEVSIQDGALQFLDRGKVLDGEAVYLSPQTGLVGSPSVDNKGVLTCECLMIADVRPGRLLVMESANVKGGYRIEKATCRGDTAGDAWGWTLECTRY